MSKLIRLLSEVCNANICRPMPINQMRGHRFGHGETSPAGLAQPRPGIGAVSRPGRAPHHRLHVGRMGGKALLGRGADTAIPATLSVEPGSSAL
jgi:hypothetical protein